MTVTELRKHLESLEAAGRGSDTLYTNDGYEYSPLPGLDVEGAWTTDGAMPVVIVDLTAVADEECEQDVEA